MCNVPHRLHVVITVNINQPNKKSKAFLFLSFHLVLIINIFPGKVSYVQMYTTYRVMYRSCLRKEILNKMSQIQEKLTERRKKF